MGEHNLKYAIQQNHEYYEVLAILGLKLRLIIIYKKINSPLTGMTKTYMAYLQLFYKKRLEFISTGYGHIYISHHYL